MSSAKAVQTEAVKTIIADFINPFAFKYRASKKMSQAASTKTNAIIPVSYTHLDVYKRQDKDLRRGDSAWCN